ncbi:hypothetical protein GQ53DRAFT_83081 [Thozetella sp. PMI_491]|nr:hypothetical protein GQ53DRAFT_83081 [Thozetella sp. PMI_491]
MSQEYSTGLSTPSVIAIALGSAVFVLVAVACGVIIYACGRRAGKPAQVEVEVLDRAPHSEVPSSQPPPHRIRAAEATPMLETAGRYTAYSRPIRGEVINHRPTYHQAPQATEMASTLEPPRAISQSQELPRDELHLGTAGLAHG